MTTLVYIQGPTKSKRPPVDELKDRGKEVPAPAFIDYTAMTAGEMKIALLRDQVGILKAFYPEVKDYQTAYNVLDAALKDGLHNISYLPGNAAQFIRAEVLQAIREKQPAASLITRRRNILSGIGDLITDSGNWSSGSSSGSPGNLIPMSDCGTNPQSPYYIQCQKDNFYRNLLNKNLEKSSHHLLYAYVNNPNERPTVVAAKNLFHNLAIEKFHQVTNVGVDNLRLWIRNGVMRSNAQNGTEPYQPEQTIQALAELVPEKQKTSVEGFPLLALIPIIKAIAGAVFATIAVIKSFKKEDQLKIEGAVQNIGLPSFGPQESDWYLTGSGAPSGGSPASQPIANNNLLPIALIAAGAFLMSKK